MVGMGLGESYVNELLDFIKSVNSGKAMEDYKRTPANTTPTTAEEFAHTWKAVYEKS
jgi:hypothetical protein